MVGEVSSTSPRGFLPNSIQGDVPNHARLIWELHDARLVRGDRPTFERVAHSRKWRRWIGDEPISEELNTDRFVLVGAQEARFILIGTPFGI